MPQGPVEGGGARAATDVDTDLSPDPSRCVFERIGAVADAVLYEGYLLYPYRRSSAKNRVRWQFGVLFPREWAESDGPVVPGVSGSADSWYQQTECLLRIRRPGAAVRLRLRFLQTQRKQVERAGRDGGHRAVESLRTDDGTVHLTFDEAVPRETEAVVPLDDLLHGGRTVPVEEAAGEDTEPLPGGAGRVVRRREQVRADITLTAERLSDDICRLRVRTVNTGRAPRPRAARDEALRRALVATHTLVAGEGAEFVSLIDPPADLAGHARACRNEFTFPVLGGEPPTGHVLLSAPIILPDHPQVAPESPGDLHDAAEIDEILTLRTMLLTDQEKREARATDPRAAAILDRVDTMPPEVFARLHGAVRSLAPATAPAAPAITSAALATAPADPAITSADPAATSADPAATSAAPAAAPAAPYAERPAWWQEGADDGLSPSTDTVLVDGVPLGGGSRVRLRPRGRGADAQDMFLAGRTAEVAAVLHDVDGSVHLAVTLDDDPASELHTWYGRFHYFRPDELEPLEPATSPDGTWEPAPAAAPARHTTDSETHRSGGR